MSLPAPPEISPDVQALIFDCDGTLADTFAAHFRAYRDALVPHGVEFTAAFYAARLCLSRKHLLAALGLETGATIDDVITGKPALDLFLKAAANLGVDPALCHVFEDSDEGLEAARRAGMAATDIRPFYRPDAAGWD